MKKTIYLESIRFRQDDGTYRYATIPQNAKWLIKKIEKYNLQLVDIHQSSDAYWCIDIKGKRKNVREFMMVLIAEASQIYNIREYSSW